MTSAAQMSYLERLRASMEELADARPNILAMIYGDSGVGKTVGAVQMAQDITGEYGRIMYIDTAQGWVSLLNHPELKARIDRMRYVNLNQLDALGEAIRNGEGGFGQYKTIVFDEASSAADTTLDDVLKYRSSLDRSKDPDTPTQPDYNTATNRIRKSFFDLLTIPNTNVIFVAHARKDKDNRMVEVTSPSFLPKLSGKIRQPLHLVAHLSGNEVNEKEYRRIYQVHPTRTIQAKTRIGGLEPQVSYEELIDKIKGWMGGTVPDAEPNVPVPDHDPETNGSVLQLAGTTMAIEGE